MDICGVLCLVSPPPLLSEDIFPPELTGRLQGLTCSVTCPADTVGWCWVDPDPSWASQPLPFVCEIRGGWPGAPSVPRTFPFLGLTVPCPEKPLSQFSSVAQSCLTLCNPMDYGTPGFPAHHQLPEPTQTHVHHLGDAIQPSHPLSSPSPPAFNLSQHQGLSQ